MSRGDLTEAEWCLLKALLPPERGRKNRPSSDNWPIVLPDRRAMARCICERSHPSFRRARIGKPQFAGTSASRGSATGSNA